MRSDTSFRLATWTAENGNVGDDYSGWLFSRALGERLQPDGDILLFGVGSILSRSFENAFRDSKVRACAVFGSGARGPASLPDLSNGDWHVYCVRGPLTACIAGLPCEKAVADPAILSPRLIPAAVNPNGPVGIVPYFTASESAWTSVSTSLGWRLVSPHQTVEDFVAQLAGCSRVWCESMHGAIFADAYGIPWRPISGTSIRNEGRTHAFKWTDWASSVGLGFDPLPGLALPERLSGTASHVKQRIKAEMMARWLGRADLQDRHLLSNRTLMIERQDRLFELLDQMCRDLTGAPSGLKDTRA